MTNNDDFPHEDANKENMNDDAADVNEQENEQPDEEPLQPHELDGYLTHCILEEDLPGIQQCMDHGAQLSFRDDNSWTPVHRAAYKGKLNALKCLVEDYGADVNVLDNQGDSPLLLSLAEGHLNIVQFLIGNCRVDPRNQRIPPLCLAVQLYFKRGLPIVKYLVEQTQAEVEATSEDEKCTPLLLCRHEAVVQYMVKEAKANVNVVNPQDGNTPLHQACAQNVPNMEWIECLVEAGANVSTVNHEGNTPLFLLCLSDGTPIMWEDEDEELLEKYGILPKVQLLVKHGGSPMIHQANRKGQTALHNCAFYNSLDVIRYLIEEHGANVNAVDEEGWTPLLRVFGGVNEKATEMVDYLVNKAGADVLCRNHKGDSCLSQCQAHNQPFEVFQIICEKTIPHIPEEDRVKYFGPMAIDAAMSYPATLQYLIEHALGEKAQLV